VIWRIWTRLDGTPTWSLLEHDTVTNRRYLYNVSVHSRVELKLYPVARQQYKFLGCLSVDRAQCQSFLVPLDDPDYLVCGGDTPRKLASRAGADNLRGFSGRRRRIPGKPAGRLAARLPSGTHLV